MSMKVHSIVKGVIKDLRSIGCVFDMCDGPDAPFENMKTCKVCSSIQRLEYTLPELKEKGFL